MSLDDIPTGQPLTAREFFQALTAGAALPSSPWEDEPDLVHRLDADFQAMVDLKRLEAEKARRDAFAEEQRQYRELDADSYWPMPGCVCPVCPPAGVTIPRPGAA